jgi:hypothetical protein
MLTVTPRRPDDTRLLNGSAALTDFGRRVLDGRQERIAACGFDRWLGGVHWERGSNEWRWDERQQRITG